MIEHIRRTEKGVTLIELVIALVISTVFLTGMASYIQGSNVVLNNISLSDNISAVRLNLQSLLINEEAWELTSSKDAFLCIELESCTGSVPFAVYDGTDTLYYDSNDPRAGFDASGKVCTTYPDGECSIKYDVNFSVVCNTCAPKQIKINIDYVSNSSSRHNSSFLGGGNFELLKNLGGGDEIVEIRIGSFSVKGGYRPSLNWDTLSPIPDDQLALIQDGVTTGSQSQAVEYYENNLGYFTWKFEKPQELSKVTFYPPTSGHSASYIGGARPDMPVFVSNDGVNWTRLTVNTSGGKFVPIEVNFNTNGVAYQYFQFVTNIVNSALIYITEIEVE